MKMKTLFETTSKGADFSECRNYRYALWRIWDSTKPLVMFIGLNPSTANQIDDDATIRRVKEFARSWGYGGFYMMNCFPLVSKKPKALIVYQGIKKPKEFWINADKLHEVSEMCQEVVFAWGAFKIVRDFNRDQELAEKFPNAKCLGKNANGSPKHPLFLKKITSLVNF